MRTVEERVAPDLKFRETWSERIGHQFAKTPLMISAREAMESASFISMLIAHRDIECLRSAEAVALEAAQKTLFHGTDAIAATSINARNAIHDEDVALLAEAQQCLKGELSGVGKERPLCVRIGEEAISDPTAFGLRWGTALLDLAIEEARRSSRS